MHVPAPIQFSAVPRGGVITADLTTYFIKCDDTTVCNLADGTVLGSVPPAQMYTYFPTAALVIT